MGILPLGAYSAPKRRKFSVRLTAPFFVLNFFVLMRVTAALAFPV
jgi:hypothetical protein